MHGFTNYCALLFHKGALLQDAEQILVQQTKNVQAARQLRFTSVEGIHELKKTITEYVYEAIEIEKAGLEVEMKKTSEYEMPAELKKHFSKDKAFEKAFYNLTPGRQRGYILYFSSAKKPETIKRRIKKYKESILKGLGLND